METADPDPGGELSPTVSGLTVSVVVGIFTFIFGVATGSGVLYGVTDGLLTGAVIGVCFYLGVRARSE